MTNHLFYDVDMHYVNSTCSSQVEWRGVLICAQSIVFRYKISNEPKISIIWQILFELKLSKGLFVVTYIGFPHKGR